MSHENWQAIKALFCRVMELPSNEREAFLLSEEARMPNLIAEVRQLMRSDEAARGFLEPPEPEKIERPLRHLSFDFSGCRLGEFELVRVIGRGASGVVYLGRQASLERDVAIKILAPHLCQSADRRERFEREAKAASKIRHPNVVSVLSFGNQDGAHFIVMEYVRGKSLHDEVELARARRGIGRHSDTLHTNITDPLVAARIIQGVAQGLEACHRAGVIHRDIKPHNIILDDHGIPRIVDFGLCRDVGLDGLSETGSLSGTPHYMSPEQARASGRAIDCRTDIYSAGAVLYEMLCLRPPFEAAAAPDLLQQILNAKPIPVHHIIPGVPRSLAGICMKALSRSPDDRYATADALSRDLHEFLEGHVVVPNLRWVIEDRASAVVRKHPWLPAVTAIGVLAALIAIAPKAGVPAEVRAGDAVAPGVEHARRTQPPPNSSPEAQREWREGMRRISQLESTLPDVPIYTTKDH